MLMHPIWMVAVAALIGAILYRIRGGWLPTGSTQLARAIWAVPTGILVSVLVMTSGANFWPQGILSGVLGAVAAFLGLLIFGNKSWQNVSTPAQWAMAAFVGAGRLALILAPLAWGMGNWWLIAFAALGGLQAPLYWIGWRLPVLGGPVDAPTAWGELFYGALVWATLVAIA